jgi:hypothetical protein
MLHSVALILICSNSFSFDLSNGSKHRDSAGFSLDNKLRIWDFEDWAYEQGADGYSSIVAYTEISESAFVFSRDLYLGHINTNLNEYVGSWPLTR